METGFIIVFNISCDRVWEIKIQGEFIFLNWWIIVVSLWSMLAKSIGLYLLITFVFSSWTKKKPKNFSLVYCSGLHFAAPACFSLAIVLKTALTNYPVCLAFDCLTHVIFWFKFFACWDWYCKGVCFCVCGCIGVVNNIWMIGAWYCGFEHEIFYGKRI